MAEYFECQVRYERTTDAGSQQKVTETYLVDAVTFGEAEARVIQELTPFTSGDLYVVAVKRCNVNEVVIDEMDIASHQDAQVQRALGNNSHASGDADKWYKAKLNFITIDEKTAKEKRQAYYLLVNAGSVDAASEVVNNYMKGSMQDWTLESIVETKIMDAFFYSADMQRKMDKRDTTKRLLDEDNLPKPGKQQIRRAAQQLADACPDGCKMSLVGADGQETVIADKTKPDKEEGDNEPDNEG